jgi:hypothetical protein
MDAMTRLYIILALIIAGAFSAAAQTSRAADTMTGVFDGRTRTLQATVDGNPFAPLILFAGTPDRLIVSFDRLAEDREYFRYSLEHCNARWQPSGLVDSEFIDGFNEASVDDYEFSRGTTTHYVNYRLSVPDERMRPLISGNYLLKIYPEDNHDAPVAQVRFSICENTAPVIGADVSAATDKGFRNRFQQVNFDVDTERAAVDDPFNDLFVTVSQNGRLDNETAVSVPLRVQGARAVFEHKPELIFNAGNEYRRFEVINTQYPTMGVESIEYADPFYHMNLYTDAPRADVQYLYDSTQHGRFRIREYNSDESDTEADYVVVHFALDAPELGPDAAVFIDGDLTYRRFDDASRMYFNPATGLFERAMLLKQGAYNYQYLTVAPGARSGATAPVEGDKWQTVNEYIIKVYHRRRGERYDRLIGTGAAISDH